VVLRHKFKLAVYDIHKEQYEFLSSLKKGLNVPVAKSKFKEIHIEDAIEFDNIWGNWKARWVAAKLFRV
jgi:hypothetical protein